MRILKGVVVRKSRRVTLGLAAVVAVPAVFLGMSSLSSEAATTLTVAADGSATYKTIQAAINAAPANSTSLVNIAIKKGTYRGHVSLPADKPNIKFTGLGSQPTDVLIVDSVPASAGGENPTAVIKGKSFEATNVTFNNDYDEAKNGGSQALALDLQGDKAKLINVRVLADQDTLMIRDRVRAPSTG
jgi:pectin methylesterase-like acyl-CoA thioesterase